MQCDKNNVPMAQRIESKLKDKKQQTKSNMKLCFL